MFLFSELKPATLRAMVQDKQFIIIGPQGSGKGTQAKALAERLGVPHISTGDMFRDNSARATPLGVQAKVLIDRGVLVPDELTNALVQARLAEADAASGFVLDGYPRNLRQAEFLRTLAPGVKAIVLELSDQAAVERIAGRRVCAKCAAGYHLQFQPPLQADVCDRCGGTLVQRSDDSEPVVRARLTTYHRTTEPLLDYYRGLGKLITIDGAPAIVTVTKNLMQTLGL